MTAADGDVFVVRFHHVLVECSSLDDAVAVKSAATLIDDAPPYDVPAEKLERLAGVLDRYDLGNAAEQLRRMASRNRAVEFLIRSRGYVSPKRS
jgi:hypothetical protein